MSRHGRSSGEWLVKGNGVRDPFYENSRGLAAQTVLLRNSREDTGKTLARRKSHLVSTVVD